ncbi:MAG: hypothetical protein ACRELV_02235 [Longimicrobiales bacterium]
MRPPSRAAPPRLRPLLLLLSLLLPLASCSGGNPWERGDPEQQPIVVHVENQNFNDATIYAVIRASRIRLGQVSGNATGSFELPYRPTDVAFEVDLLAGRTFTTNTVLVTPGDEVQLVIAADLSATRVYR